MRWAWLLAGVVGMVGAQSVLARQTGPMPDVARVLPGAASTEALAAQLRTFVLDFMPDPLHEDSKRWGQQKKNARGKMKNDGRWLRYRITGRNLRDGLQLRVENLRKQGARSTFDIQIAFEAQVLLERQTWLMGARLYSGSTRARFKVYLTLNCELTTKVDKATAWLPDMIVRLRVVKSDFRQDDLVVEHTAGVGGDMAKVLGELIVESVKLAKPNLERDLANKINAAVVKAGDTKEVRVSLADLLSGKKILVAPKPAAPAVKKP
ncbi:MAG: hypothetical protein U0840_26125 [Gemmataceae bacterium]